MLTGIGTVTADDPQLTVREVDTPRQPLRVIVDSRLETPHDARILQGERCWFSRRATARCRKRRGGGAAECQRQGRAAARCWRSSAQRGVNELHVEAGFRLNGSLVREGCVDEFLVYLNPSFLGDGAQGMLDLPAVGVARRAARS